MIAAVKQLNTIGNLWYLLARNRGGVRYSIDKGAYVWNSNGRQVSDGKIQNELDKLTNRYHENVGRLADRLDSGNLTIAQWQDRMRKEIKDIHRTQYIIGRGGREQMTQRDYGRLGADLRWMQYRKLDAFALEIAEGNLSAAQIRARANLYMNAAKKQYRRGQAEADMGIEDEPQYMWVLGSTKESCSDCLRLNGQVKTMREWEDAGIEPQSPDLECGGWNCKCKLVRV